MRLRLIKLELDIDAIIIGERVKGGIYRPCIETIPSSTVAGAFKYALGIDVIGAGFLLEGTYEKRDFTYCVKDRYLETARMPLIASCLYPAGSDKIKAEIYLSPKNLDGHAHFEQLELFFGALKTKGFGKAMVKKAAEVDSEIRQGILKVRVLEAGACELGIKPLAPVYGYLFCPQNLTSGTYRRALFEGSLVKAPEVFLKEFTFYDE